LPRNAFSAAALEKHWTAVLAPDPRGSRPGRDRCPGGLPRPGPAPLRLRERGPVWQSVLAADFGLSPHSITDIVDGLERLGMAERRPDPTDRRAKLVAITDAGQAGLDVANATRQRLLTDIFGALSEADLASLLRLLDSLDEAARRLTAAPAIPA
jgi:DNA-binding MarR family transcriptional regulator